VGQSVGGKAASPLIDAEKMDPELHVDLRGGTHHGCPQQVEQVAVRVLAGRCQSGGCESQVDAELALGVESTLGDLIS
jgi:hypothetical protein